MSSRIIWRKKVKVMLDELLRCYYHILTNINDYSIYSEYGHFILFIFYLHLDEPPEDDIHPNEMEICDPCYCYGKCCLDVVASIFCVSLL
jgi:hypothetical protein